MDKIPTDQSGKQKKIQGDGLSHFHLMNYRARAVVAVTTEVVRESQRRHSLDPLTTIAFGRAISCVALLASTLKKANEYIHGTISGDGVLKRVVAECNGAGDCRGYTAPFTLVSVLGQREGSQDSKVPESVGEAIGQGRLTVTKGSYGEGTPYAAIVDLATGEIAADFARFLTESEQIPSAVAAGVKLNHKGQVISAGGILVQRLGGAVVSDDELKGLGDKISKINLSDRIALGESAEDLIKYMQDTQEAWGLLAQRELRFKCTCTREKMALTAMGLGPAELENLISEVGKIEVNCAYCSSSQQFNLSELAKH